MGRGEAKNKRKSNKGAEEGEKINASTFDNNSTPGIKNPFANLLCDLCPYNLPQLRDAEAKYFARIESSKVEPWLSVFSAYICRAALVPQQTCTAPQ